MSIDTLKVRQVGIDTYHENVAYLNRECSVYRAEGFQALSKIQVSNDGSKLLAVLNVVDDNSIVLPGELGLSQQAFNYLKVKEGTLVTVNHAEPPKSMDAVRRKINGERLNQADFNDIAHDIVQTRYSKMEMAAFLVATGQNNLDRDEILYLTQAMLESGEKMDWHEPLVADKHCIGGIPGNRTSMLVVPIVAAHGMLMPKTSSRAITSPAGTADTMEVLANVNIEPSQMLDIVRQERGCLSWGGTAKLAPVDDLLISVERPLGIDSQGQMVASILSKKLAAGSTHLIIDIPVGPTAKVRHMRQALALRKLFEFVGDHLNIHLEVMITDGRQPIGKGIGPVLEARDVMQVLNNDPSAPADLRQKSLLLAGRIIEFDPDVRGGQGYAIARDILDSGRAYAKMHDIIKAQGESEIDLQLGELCYQVCAERDGVVISIDNFQMSKVARLAGAPMDKKAGVDLLKKLGDEVKKGEALYKIYAEFPADFNFSTSLAQQNSGYVIGEKEQILKPLVDF
ncbi:thymidine phosphorylase family protein [methanotrophic endosymbiont of Bathymodiolus puteoserpentis (Logatchev)]|jgi:thymidine phosphorylase|uniref:thymidine phosphorylase family protein n=1 Tax=methanotrophic endosymbiont of Bathymodiolus puteoserpentis (Logatchev) TaxID=343235 RepID=UPI0013C9FD87|nr:thymidine phosphorylase family protein [methanotrophic endosymbiont of Bathymodiolus puteoserpentis (Logatchev)]SHE20869.1 Thymidine phosphorylase [methanotrophic endosymbiont of Bathymodiolus puteoserpentis (Logatchev)]